MTEDLPISVDFETRLVTNAEPIPEPACLSICWSMDEPQDLLHARDPACKRIMRDLVEGAAAGKNRLCGFFIAFDMAVAAKHFDLWEQVFAAYETYNAIHCEMVRQKLIDIARGVHRGYRNGANDKWVEHNYNLADVSTRYGLPPLDKDTWRLRYGELIDVSLEQWPEAARVYPLDDTAADLAVHIGQLEYKDVLDDEFRQSYTSFDLLLTSADGLTTDPEMIDVYQRFVQRRIDSSKQLLIDKGYLKYFPKKEKYKREDKLVRAYAKSVWAAKGLPYPETATGNISLDEASCLKSGDPVLIAYQTYSSAQTQQDRVNELADGVNGSLIHTRFDELLKSGRTSSSKPNVQNRSTAPVGDRESFAAPEGEIDIDMDFDGLELRTIAQGCRWAVGFSRLGEVLNAGEDPHLMVAARLVGCDYDEAKVRYKQKDPDIIDARGAGKAKMVNFSCWAGTTIKGLWHHAAEVGYNYTMDQAAEIYQAFLDSWPEAEHYFKWVKQQCRNGGTATMMCFRSNRYAGMLSRTEACSVISQGLGADATKEAYRALMYECYVGNTILRGARVKNYIHDQFHIRVKDDKIAHDKAELAGQIAREAANKWLPDVPTRAKPMLVRRWSKLAEPVYKNGRLVPWDINMLGPRDPKGNAWPSVILEMQDVATAQEKRRNEANF